MQKLLTVNHEGERTGMINTGLVVGKIRQITACPNVTQVVMEDGEGKYHNMEIDNSIFKDVDSVEELYGSDAICAVVDRTIFVPSTDGVTVHDFQHVIHFVSGPKVGKTLTYRRHE